MLSSMACVGAPSSNRRMRGTRNLVLVVEVHDNDRLQLPCFDDHASLEIGPRASASRSKIVSTEGTCGLMQQ